MKFAVINTETNKLVQPRNYYFVIKQNGELWTVNHDLSFTKADDKYSYYEYEEGRRKKNTDTS